VSEVKPPRTLLSGVIVSFGVIHALVDLVPAQQSKATRAKANIATRSLCPTCDGDVPLASKLWCEHGHGPFSTADARKGISSGVGAVVPVSDEEVAEAKAPTIAERKADLSVFPAEQVEAVTFPNGNIFRLRSEPTKTYGLLRALVANPAHAYVCEMVVKGKTCLYRAIAQSGTIVLTELTRPERVFPAEPVEVSVDPELVAHATGFAEAMLSDFDPAEWADVRGQRLQVLESTGRRSPAPMADADVGVVAEGLLALLETPAA
jgi:non-homologous end joining protein Ku